MSTAGASRRQAVVIPTGVANVASMVAALERVDAVPQISDSPARVADAEHVVLPGVGAFGAGMEFLNERGLARPLRERAAAGRPLLAVCLGLQLLFEASEESPDHHGLGIVPGTVTRFSHDLVVPHMGWNLVDAAALPSLETGYAYFANSYRVDAGGAPPGWRIGWTDYGGRFVAAMQRGDLLACQFHPELSGRWGLDLLRRWLERPQAGAGPGEDERAAAGEEERPC